LGLDSATAYRELLVPESRRPEGEDEEVEPAFDVSSMRRLLGGHYRDTREQLLEVLREPKFRYRYGLAKDAYVMLVDEWCRDLAGRGYGGLAYAPEYGGQGDVGRFLAVVETLGYHDLSLAVKFGIQFGLFGGSISDLGTERHREKYLRDVASMELSGCYALTEAAHGSNVRDIETIARFDKATGEFVIETPTGRARKAYIGNATDLASMATVFAQLEVGGSRYGVHAFLVPLREESGQLYPGVRTRESGVLCGLNGVGHASIWLNRVRVPRENLLNRFAYVSEDGVYATTIPSDSKRFFTMLGTLVGGRISAAAMALSGAKSGLTIAIRYGTLRRQFGPGGAPEVKLMDYRSHQRRLMPALATTYALDFALKHLIRTYLAHRGQQVREVEALSAAIKAYTTWHAERGLQICREACGGAGYLAVNRFASLHDDLDGFTTLEGDNTVLMQLVARSLLAESQEEPDESQFVGALKEAARKATRAIAELNPIVVRLTDESHLRDPQFQLGAMRFREAQLRAGVATRLRRRIRKGLDPFMAFNECQDHLSLLAHAHVERVTLEQVVEAIQDVPDKSVQGVLKTICDLFSLSRIEADAGWFLESGYIESNKARAIRRTVNRLCAELRGQALPLVDAFGIPDEVLGAPIAVDHSGSSMEDSLD
jgi:acyl-CoA oxidase